MEDNMIARIFKNLHLDIGGGPSGFERYFRNLQSQAGPGAPSREDARRDYRAFKRIRQ